MAIHTRVSDEQLADLVAKFNNVLSYVSSQFVGREEAIEAQGQGLLTGYPVFLIGKPGVAKTSTTEALAQCIIDDATGEVAKSFKTPPLKGDTPLERLVGPMNIKKFMQDNEWVTETQHGMISAKGIVIWDEISRAGSLVKDGALELIRTGLMSTGYEDLRCEALVHVATANFKTKDAGDKAFYDRWVIANNVSPLTGEDSLKLNTYYRMRAMGQSHKVETATITVAEVKALRGMLPTISISKSFDMLLDDLYTDLLQKEIFVSDRRRGVVYPLLQATALLNGHTEVDEEHLYTALRFCLWEEESQIPIISTLLKSKSGDFELRMEGYKREADNEYNRWVESITKAGGKIDSAMTKEVGQRLSKIKDEVSMFGRSLEQAGKSQRKIERAKALYQTLDQRHTEVRGKLKESTFGGSKSWQPVTNS